MLLLAGLGGCSADINAFAPACPVTAILPDAADLTRYKSAGRDITDMVLDARISGLAGSCKQGDRRDLLDTSLTVALEVTRGPGAPSRVAEFSYFVAVMKGDQILDRQTYPQSISFPDNVDRLRVTSDQIDMVFPVPKGMSGAAYRVLVGFQLSPDELETNRQRGPR